MNATKRPFQVIHHRPHRPPYVAFTFSTRKLANERARWATGVHERAETGEHFTVQKRKPF